jgi:hypothetical protein
MVGDFPVTDVMEDGTMEFTLRILSFSFRNSDSAKKKELYQKTFDDFETDTRQKFPENADAICLSVSPRMAGFHMRGSGAILRI